MGPILFLLYILPLKQIVDQYRIMRHGYADDTQLYCRLPIQDAEETHAAAQRMNACIDHVRRWMLKNKLLINDDKTELLLLGPKRAQAVLESMNISIQVGESHIETSSSARNLGVELDASMTMERQVAATVKSAYFHLRRIHSIRRYLTDAACAKSIHACVTSRLDYSNALLLGCTSALKQRLQIVQNNAARSLSKIRDRRQHITPVLKQLHWLPIEGRIQYKVLLMIHCAMHNHKYPLYLRDFINVYHPLPQLRSASDHTTLIPMNSNSRIGLNAFTCKGFTLWNALPSAIRSITSRDSFKRHLKTYLFNSHYQ